ncbi:MAG: lipopolysaccharide biosynthesis protein [Paucibacter sp.]|nr:lipopolysaccharide biosynthesis protein [Roseateles sp.]
MTGPSTNFAHAGGAGEEDSGLLDILISLVSSWRLLSVAPLAAGALALGVSYLVAPTYTAKTTFLPPQQQQNAAASALASIGALSGLAGVNTKTAADQFVSLMQSVNAEDRIVDRFELMKLYDVKYRFEARKRLEDNVRINLGKKDGLITVEADAPTPQLAADLANQHVAELRRLTGELALTEAQQRRVFFEGELKRTQAQLTDAQQKLQNSGFNPGALKTEPKAEVDNYAKIKAQATAAEVQLQVMRQKLADTSPEVQQQLSLVDALRRQMQQLESSQGGKSDSDYVARYREFKYQETLLDLLSKQFELARMDESRDGALIQVVDVATLPEHKSKPKRALIAVGTTVGVWVLLLFYVLCRHFWREAASQPDNAEKFANLRRAWRRR